MTYATVGDRLRLPSAGLVIGIFREMELSVYGEDITHVDVEISCYWLLMAICILEVPCRTMKNHSWEVDPKNTCVE